MLDVDPIKLINAIKARPPLYNKCDKTYHGQIHRKPKERLWREVGEEVHPSWNQLNLAQKCDFVREIQKRWKNLRTCFTREIGLQRLEKQKLEANEPVKRRKRYEYFDYLIFLNEITGPEPPNYEGSEEDDNSAESEPFEYHGKAEAYDFAMSQEVVNENVKVENPVQHFQQPQLVYDRSNVDEKVLDMLKDMKKDEYDEDRQFMLSMVPSFKRLDQNQKIAARIEMLKVLQSFTSPAKE